jgi:hypothetical protein
VSLWLGNSLVVAERRHIHILRHKADGSVLFIQEDEEDDQETSEGETASHDGGMPDAEEAGRSTTLADGDGEDDGDDLDAESAGDAASPDGQPPLKRARAE